MGKVIAVANQKGGVGKTTTAVNVSAILAKKNKKVLFMDCDPQGNGTSGLGVSKECNFSTYDVLINNIEIVNTLQKTRIKKLDVCPTNMNLAGAEVELVDSENREYRLKEKMDKIKDDYDFIIIDCPPSLGLITINALVSADSVIIPVQCEYYALEGVGELLKTINLVKKYYNEHLSIEGALMTMFDPRTRLSTQVVYEVKKYFGNKVFNTTIPRNVRLSEAPSYGEPINLYDPFSKGARAYDRFAKEIINNNKN